MTERRPRRRGTARLDPKCVPLRSGIGHGTRTAVREFDCPCHRCEPLRQWLIKHGPGPYPVSRTFEPVELPPRVTHGSLHAYNVFGCRCDDCAGNRIDYDHNRYNLLGPLRQRERKS